ncbi:MULTISPECIES: leucyl aminopeptidase family protein [unclassified Rhodanobacter]|uniref:leucyl aminopeptidase family protein n=1 Tax=unclassified Rhodanobacter TaxID=2621553 RepID=UPI001BE00EF6|nr:MULTISPECIES: leucyl aminopeptidase family protein [unclassified Rhodanobacter]MBT2145669.1 leucyl aminopeptidase family protein [Rhodanobacter sp. LX-99]MBT2149834.1 leucyl aminopeptidase family protein [Rhodanobacter sp. LX-100]
MSALIERQPGTRRSIAIETTDAAHYAATRRRLTAAQRRWLADSGFEAAAGTFALLPDAAGKLVRVLAGVDARQPLAALAALPCSLPEATYHLADEGVLGDPARAALGWALGAYQFNRYRQPKRAPARLAVPAAQLQQLAPLVEATALVRDLVNTPTEDMGPEQLGDAIRQLGKTHKAKVRDWVGDELLKANFPTIHAVGRASHRAPRLIELSWGRREHPRLVLVGKGVCFDTGGLDLKPSDGMRWMKKDMGGAAHAIALAGLVMQAQLPVRLTLLIPAVENAVAGNALRPGEVVVTRAGHAVEIDNTDAEGRLVLCDALAYGAEQQPDLMLDFATLTGAARVALGPDLPALFANDDDAAAAVLAAGSAVDDPLWQLPLWRPYRKMLDSYLADFANAGPSRHAGAITAALYLERFVPDGTPWLHLDTYAWNDADRPGRPRGGEAMGLRATFAFLRQRYGG